MKKQFVSVMPYVLKVVSNLMSVFNFVSSTSVLTCNGFRVYDTGKIVYLEAVGKENIERGKKYIERLRYYSALHQDEDPYWWSPEEIIAAKEDWHWIYGQDFEPLDPENYSHDRKNDYWNQLGLASVC